ncbi:hypothetical protein [Psychrobacillus sp. BM2]
MSKLIKILIFVSTSIILFCILFLYQLLNPTLSSIQVNENNEESIYISPD